MAPATVVSLEHWRNSELIQPQPDPQWGELAAWLADLYRSEGLSLADPNTVAAFRVALGAVSVIVDGALTLGHLECEPEQIHAYLQGILHDARTASDLL